jgi:hypothetical protein
MLVGSNLPSRYMQLQPVVKIHAPVRGVNNGGDTSPPEFWVGGTPICDVPPRIWLKIDRNVKYFLRIFGDFITNLMQINSSVQTKSVLNSVTVSHIHRERLDVLGITQSTAS